MRLVHLGRRGSLRSAGGGKAVGRGPRGVLASNSLAIIAAAGKSLAIRKAADLAANSVRHVALADPASPLGKVSRTYLEQLGLYEKLWPKVVQVDNSRGIVAAIQAGRAEAGLAFASDADQATECRVLAQDRSGRGIARLFGRRAPRRTARGGRSRATGVLCHQRRADAVFAVAGWSFRSCPLRRRSSDRYGLAGFSSGLTMTR